VKDFEVSLWY